MNIKKNPKIFHEKHKNHLYDYKYIMHYFSEFCSCNNVTYSLMTQHNTDTRFPFTHAHVY